jgi:tetratricopeptide (TPR) repeat protein
VLCLGLLAAGVVLGPVTAHAQARAGAAQRAQDAEARALFEEGRAHAEAERWVEALDAFRRSRAVSERPTTIFNIATTLIRLGRAQEALATITELERVADPRQHARILTDAAEIRRQAEASLRHVTLRVSPPTATVEVDGEIAAGDGAERTMVLDPGAHAIVVSADGHGTERFSLEPGTDTREVTLGQLDGTLRIVPSVESAAVSIDGALRGTGTLELALPPAAYTVGITADGYHPFERTVELAAGASLTVDAALELIPPDPAITESPLFWGLLGGGAAILIGVGIGLGVAFGTTTEAPYGGTSNTVIVPLLSGSL